MATDRMSRVVQHLRRAVLLHDTVGASDGQLLEDYLSRREEAAFAALVRRHGPMVWGVCRRVLGDHHDSEDAFQATFLVLVRKAASVLPRESVANWLYGVAYRTAVKARAMAVKRKVREKQVKDLPEPGALEQDSWNDLQPLLDQELSRLPDRYRLPIVLCDLEGKTYKMAARQLGCPEGTLAARLARARALLAKRLARHGVTLSAGALATVLSRHATAGVPAAVVSSTIRAASLFAAGQAAGEISVKVAALTEGVLKAMLVSRLKKVTVVLLLLALACYGVSALRHSATAAGQPEAAPEELPVQKKPEGAAKPVLKVHALVEEVDVKNNTVTAVIVDGNLSHAEALAALLVELVERSPNKRKATTIVNLSLAKDVKVPRDALITDAGKINLNALQHKILTLQLTVGPRGLVVVGILPGSRGGDKMAAFHMEFEPGKIMYEMYDKKADDKPIVRVYSVSDLVGRSDQVDADHLIQVITRVIEPASWDVMGGSATVQYYPLGKSLVISQSAAAHERVQTLLDALRKAKAAQEKSQK